MLLNPTLAHRPSTPAPQAPRAAAPRPTRCLQLPDASGGWRYALTYWQGTVANLLRSHRLRVGRAQTHYRAPVVVGAVLRQQWLDLFAVPPGGRAPLLFNQSVGTLLYTQVFADLGINFRHLLHRKHEVHHVAGAAACADATRQLLDCSLAGVTRLSDNQAVVSLRTEVHDGDSPGTLLAVITDRFIVRKLPPADLAHLPTDRTLVRETLQLRKRRPALSRASHHTWVESIVLPADLGVRYGRVSGDNNPVHTRPLLARLFGVKRLFAQGLALRNAVVARLSALELDLSRLQITFACPAWLDQTLELRLADTCFELVGEAGEVVAFGSLDAR